MKKLQLLLLTLLIPFLGYTQITTFPWSHDFDNGITLEQDTTDDGDWLLNSGPTPSTATGPSEDHTTGNGIYSYVEASTPNYPYKTFICYTPTFDVSYTPGRILSFWYHMFGSTIGDLEILTVENDTIYTPIEKIIGDQGDQWHLANYNLDSLNVGGPFKIAFIGFTGNSFYSDIAIDDILVGDSVIVNYGCLDFSASNFDSTATVDDGSCVYPPCNGLNNLQGSIQCFQYAPNQGQVSVSWDPPTNPGCKLEGFHYGPNLNNLSYTPYNTWNGNNYYSYVSSTPVSSPDYYFIVETVDGNLDTLILQNINCGVGCTDSTATNYNPFAGVDDGSCASGTSTACGDTINSKITVLLTPDTYASETSWNITDSNGVVLASEGGGFYQTTGVPVSTDYCIPLNAEITFNLFDSYGDGMCGSCFNGVDGEVIVFDECGDTIYSLIPSQGDNSNFGNEDTSDVYNISPCPSVNPDYGCKDQAYLEYNSLATSSDPSMCLTLAIPGCIDNTMFNYDPLANTMDLIPNCNYTLELFDGGGDGWDNSYLGVVQDGNPIGAFTCNGSNSIYNINISALTHIEFTFYEVKNQQGVSTDVSQCVFKLKDSFGNVVYQKGNNPWLNPIVPLETYTPTLNCGNYCIPVISGCTDITALNYSTTPNTLDNSCLYILGCMDNDYLEFDALADTSDGSCLTLIALGCTDASAFNYDPLANTDNGGCIAKTFGCTDSTQFNYDINANTDDSSCEPFIYGCTDATQFNFDPLANTNDGSCIAIVYGCIDNSYFNYDPSANTDNGSCISYIYGCTDSTAFNYNLNANTSDGSCIPILLGCTDSTALNYNALANTDDGSCISYLYGCTDSTAINYNALANTDNGTCIPYIYGCTDPTAFNYDPLANTNDGCIPYIYGCTDNTQYNYDPLANTLDNSCIPYIYGCTDNTMFNYNASANTDNGSCEPFIYGCMDSTAFNYDPLVNTDNGSCQIVIYGCTNPTAINFDPLANTDDGTCINPVYGCMDSTMFNYNPLANVDNGSCISYVYGCTDPLAFNYNPAANTNDNSCCLISGCTDSTALNYNQFACFDDNSCITIITGCTDVSAFNYDPTANVTDSTACLYDAGCYGGPGIPYWLNDVCYAWVIDIDNNCCTDDWDSYCVNLYDYCQQGMPTNIEELLRENDFIIYPNPTKDIVNLAYNKNAKIDLYGPLGKLMVSGDNIKQIDLNAYSNGIYVLYITYNDKTITHKIVKQ